jgi:hypothetical protein
MTTINPPTSEGQAAYPVAQFARLFGRSSAWGYSVVKSGTVRTVKVGGSVFVPADEVDRLLAEGTTP